MGIEEQESVDLNQIVADEAATEEHNEPEQQEDDAVDLSPIEQKASQSAGESQPSNPL